MTHVWKLQDAKNRFSEVVERAINEGPQSVQRRGKDAVVVVSAEQFKKMSKPKKSWYEFLRSCPVDLSELDLTRDKDTGRDINL